jgi:membrane-bound lytic murein transglycosylase D
LVPAGYRIKLPEDRSVTPLVEVSEISTAPAPRRSQPQAAQVVQHRVKRGETLTQIAQRYGASVQRILQVNGIRHAHFIKVGTMLRIPKI